MVFLWSASLVLLAGLCLFVYLAVRVMPEIGLRYQKRVLTLVVVAGLVMVVAQLRNAMLGMLGGVEGMYGVMVGSLVLEVPAVLFLLAATYYLFLSEREEISPLRRSAQMDPLTSLHNQAYFRRATSRRISQARAYEMPLSLAMVDIDDFKSYNDRHGHEAGNEVLKNVAGILRSSLRANDLVARYGGEEFVLLLDCDLASAQVVLERVRANVEAFSTTPGAKRGEVTISIGISQLGESTTSVERFIEVSDEALYRAKSAGKNRVITSEGEAA